MLGCGLVSAEDSSVVLLNQVDFESGDLTQIERLTQQKGSEDAISLVTEPVRAGKFAAKTRLRFSDPEVNKGQRAEFSDGARSTKIEMNRDYWYGLSIYVTEAFNPPENSDAVLFQWHTQQGGPSPVLAIRVNQAGWRITTDATEKRRTLARPALEKGRWTDWVVHVHWSAEQSGYWTIWKDGVEIINERDIVTQYPEALGPYAKFGQYHSVSDDTPENVVYFDEYRVAGPGGSYKAVAPREK